MPEIFTREQAEALLPALSPLLRSLQAAWDELVDATTASTLLRERMIGDGHAHISEMQSLTRRVETARQSVNRSISLGGISGMAALVTEDITFASNGGSAQGYLARPDDDAQHPGLIVIQEWWGLNDHIKDVARRYADAGYVALAPDLFHGKMTTEPNDAQ